MEKSITKFLVTLVMVLGVTVGAEATEYLYSFAGLPYYSEATSTASPSMGGALGLTTSMSFRSTTAPTQNTIINDIYDLTFTYEGSTYFKDVSFFENDPSAISHSAYMKIGSGINSDDTSYNFALTGSEGSLFFNFETNSTQFMTGANIIQRTEISWGYFPSYNGGEGIFLDIYNQVYGYSDSDRVFPELPNFWTVTEISQTPVPEPSSMILLGGGIAGLAYWRRKKTV